GPAMFSDGTRAAAHVPLRLAGHGCAEPAGERFAYRGRGRVGWFLDGCGPRDVDVRADQETVDRSVIGVGAVDVDAMLPVMCDLAKIRRSARSRKTGRAVCMSS